MTNSKSPYAFLRSRRVILVFMKVTRLKIENFRGVKSAEIHFQGHALIIGRNNVGKSTVCEALDLLLGPDRLHGNSSIDEYDFYNANYLSGENEERVAVPLKIEGVLIDLSPRALSIFSRNLEFWHTEEQKLLAEGELDTTDHAKVTPCLRLELLGTYDQEEDEFVAKTFYSHSPDEAGGGLTEVSKTSKREIGFLYLRAIRTGSRALSLERGSLLDILLKIGQFKPRLWEDVRTQLRDLDPPIDTSVSTLRPILDNIEARIKQYIPIEKETQATELFVSQLTREHLRKTLSFFMSLSSDQEPVPFQKLGTGTLNTLVFALLSAIAELKKENVIFAMEEPEIAVSPHTQRRIVNYLLENTSQSFVTSHSPYVIERFAPEQILILRRDTSAHVTGTSVQLGAGLKRKHFFRGMRKSIAEAMLGRAVMVGEGITECQTLSASAEILEADNPDLYPMDLSGVSFIDADGDGLLGEYGLFFKSLGLETFAFYDQKTRPQAQIEAIAQGYDIAKETTYDGMERLLTEEIPVQIQWDYIDELRTSGLLANGPLLPTIRPTDEEVKNFTLQVLRARKGDFGAANLIRKCASNELPQTVVTFLREVYARFPKPAAVPPLEVETAMTEPENPSEAEPVAPAPET